MTNAYITRERSWFPLAGVLTSLVTMLLQPLVAYGAERAETPGKAAAAGFAKAPTGPSSAPPAGRYRCYQPPRYTVVSWFDLDANGSYRVLDHDPAPYRYESATRRVAWLNGDHAERGWVGLYLPPASDGAGGIRHTIVMTNARNLKPPKDDRDTRPQCYLTTH